VNAIGSKFRGFKNKKAVSFSDIGDGASNTFAVSEFSGGENKVANFAPRRASWSVGAAGAFVANGFFVPSFTYQTKSISFPINSSNPAHYNQFVNSAPLNSSHSGGINTARADGSVSFVDDTIDLQLLMYLSGIDDGRVVSEF